MSPVEVVVAAHTRYYPDGGNELENTRFFANLSILLANALGDATTVAQLTAEAHEIEQQLRLQHG